MKNRQILWAIVFGSMLAITGCGDDDGGTGDGGSSGSGGSAGAGGTAGTGGSAGTGGGGGPASSSCEAFCNNTCSLMGVEPDDPECLTSCQANVPQLDDECGPQADALVGCVESVGCEPGPGQCVSELTAWSTCAAVLPFP